MFGPKLTSKVNQEKVISAIDAIIKDSDKNLDECLVEKFIGFIRDQFFLTQEEAFKLVEPILKRLKFYLDHQSFVMLNQTRALKVFNAAFKCINLDENRLSEFSVYFESLWNIIDTLVLNDNLGAVQELLRIFYTCSSSISFYQWLVDKSISPPIKVSARGGGNSSDINDVISLIRFYIENRKNYHTSNEADSLFKRLAFISITNEEATIDTPQVISFRRTIKELVTKGSTAMIAIVGDLIHKFPNRPFLFEKFDIPNTFLGCYLSLLDKPNMNTYILCKCLALTNSKEDSVKTIAALKTKKQLDGLVVYLSYSRRVDIETDQHLLTHLLYPLLSNSQDEEAQMLTQRLIATREDKDFIERNRSNKSVLICLAVLQMMFNQHGRSDLQRPYSFLSNRTFDLIVHVLIHYITKQGFETKNYKNAMAASNLLDKFLSLAEFKNASVTLQSLESIQRAIDSIELSETTKPITLKLIKALCTAHRKFSVLIEGGQSGDCINRCLLKTVELALKVEDHDVLDEYARCLATNAFVFDLLKPDQKEEFVKLVWTHIYEKAKATDHRELLGNLAPSLIRVDSEAEATLLAKFNLRRHHEIPKLLGDILIEKSAVFPTVELIVEAIGLDIYESSLEKVYQAASGKKQKKSRAYFFHLDSPTLPGSVKTNLDHLTRGLCVAVKGESSENCRQKALHLISNLVEEIIINQDCSELILKRLVRTRILETLYEVSTGCMYSEKLVGKSNHTSQLIRSFVIKKLDHPQDLITNSLRAQQQEATDHGPQEGLARLCKIANFYLDSSPSVHCSELYSTSDDTEVSSVIDEILEYERRSDAILDCY